jgi:hypothetical protein
MLQKNMYVKITIFCSQEDLIKITKEENNKPIEVGGSLGDMWLALESTLNFS